MSHFSQTVSTHTYGRVKSSYIEDTIHSRNTVDRNVWIMSGQLPKVTFVSAIKVLFFPDISSFHLLSRK